MYRYYKQIAGLGSGNYIYYRKSKGLPDERINSIKTPGYGITLKLNYCGTKTRVEFNGSCLKQDKITSTNRKIVKIYIIYELTGSTSEHNDPTVKYSLFGAVRLTKNAEIDKYGYSGYGIGFDRRGGFSLPSTGLGRNVIIFGVGMSSSTKIDNRKKGILILVKGATQGIEHTLSAEKMYSINFTVTGKKFCLSLHYNGANSYLFVNGTEIYKFKAKDSEIVATPLCLGNISKDWTVDNMRETGLNWYVYDFSDDYDAIAVDDILDISNYLIKKNDTV